MKPAWFPDWSGQTCVVVASGPSAKAAPLEIARGKARVVVINNSWALAPWADLLYGCDYQWWSEHRGVPDFKGLKICGDARAKGENWGCETVRVLNGVDTLWNEPGEVGRGGGSSGFQAVNLAVQWGVSRIVLVGFDCSIKEGIHWHGPHGRKLNNPGLGNTRNWQRAMDGVAKEFSRRGIVVINASTGSTLKAYPKMSLAAPMALQCPAL